MNMANGTEIKWYWWEWMNIQQWNEMNKINDYKHIGLGENGRWKERKYLIQKVRLKCDQRIKLNFTVGLLN